MAYTYTQQRNELSTPNDITYNFCQLSVDSQKEYITDWLLSSFPKSDIRDTLIKYISRLETRVEDMFYHKDKECVIFYFQIYNCISKQSHYKRICRCDVSKKQIPVRFQIINFLSQIK